MKAAAFSVVLIVMSEVIAGQTSGSGGSSAQTSESSNSAKLQTVRGCLSKTGDTYVILGGNPVRQYRIVGGDTEALKHKLGHTVEVTGPAGQEESGATTNGLYNSGSTTGVGYDTITAQSVKEVFANCS